jgi:hypothetical protein
MYKHSKKLDSNPEKKKQIWAMYAEFVLRKKGAKTSFERFVRNTQRSNKMKIVFEATYVVYSFLKEIRKTR